MGRDFSLRHASALAAQLPRDARVRVADNLDAAWSDETLILWQLEYDMRMLQWSMSDKKSRGAKPKPIESPSQRESRAERLRDALSKRQQARKILGMEGLYGN